MISTPEVMQHIQNVIKETTIPSWLRSVPKNFGEAKAGTLKADEWRTLATIYLPLALCLIGHLQRLPINHKFGELEQTVLDSFIQGSKLRHWLGQPDSPAAIKECKLLFDKYISNSEVSISEFVPKRAPKQAVPTELRLLTSRKHLVLHACTNFGGTVFSRHSSHQGNSSIMFYPGGSQSRPPIPDLEVVRLEWVMCHCAQWNFSEKHVVILPLLQVSVLMPRTCYS
ncbi:hypothetical protein BKA83DRAFT_4041305 [Pisolithus microcarpus]|nr:hypothetical protein BKA83DRAFT_4041305 [Pisolithus microcarpus]